MSHYSFKILTNNYYFLHPCLTTCWHYMLQVQQQQQRPTPSTKDSKRISANDVVVVVVVALHFMQNGLSARSGSEGASFGQPRGARATAMAKTGTD